MEMSENLKYILRLVSIDTIIDTMLTKTQYKIMELLTGSQKYSIRAAARRLRLSYALAYNNISKLISLGYVEKEDVPPASILRLSAPDDILTDVENRKRQDFLARHNWARLFTEDFHKQFQEPFYVMLVFGSYAKNSQTKRSDIDVIIITENTTKAEKALQNIIVRKKLHSHVFTSGEFGKMLSEGFSIGNEAVQDHIILYGIDSFLSLR